jgi:hypothetical protein
METNNAAYERPMDMLQRLLPTVGYTVSTDAADIYRALYRRGMSNGELKARIAAWVAKAERSLAAHEAATR